MYTTTTSRQQCRHYCPPSPIPSRVFGQRSDAVSDSHQIQHGLNLDQRLPPCPEHLGAPFSVPHRNAHPDEALGPEPPASQRLPNGLLLLPHPEFCGTTFPLPRTIHLPESPVPGPSAYQPLPNGIPAPPLTRPAVSPDIGTLKILKSVFKLRDKIISKRHSLRIERQNYSDQRGHVHKAQVDFQQLANEYALRLPTIGPEKDVHLLAAAFQRLEHSDSLRNSLERKVQEAENEIDLLEDRLLEKEGALYEALSVLKAQLFGPAESFEHRSDDDSLSELESNDIESTTTVATIISEYYKKASQANRLRDDLFNFEQEHQRQMFTREEEQDEGLHMSPSEITFLMSYFQERREKIHEFSLAKQEAEKLYYDCMDRGFKVEEPAVAPFPDADALDHSNRISRRIAEAAVNESIGRADAGLLIEGQNSHERVSTWLEQVNQALTLRVDSMDALDSGAAARSRTTLGAEGSPGSHPYERAESSGGARFSLPSESPQVQPVGASESKRKQRSFHGEAVRKRYSDPSFVNQHSEFRLEDGWQARGVRSLR
jgi:hypothetical protein